MSKEPTAKPPVGYPSGVKTRRPLSFVKFSAPIVLQGTKVPTTTLIQGQRKAEWHSSYEMPGMWLDPDRREIVIGNDVFPQDGGLIAQYRYSRMAKGKAPDNATEATGPVESMP